MAAKLFGMMIKSSICNCFPSGSIFISRSGFEVPIRLLTWSKRGCGPAPANDEDSDFLLLSASEVGVAQLAGVVAILVASDSESTFLAFVVFVDSCLVVSCSDKLSSDLL